MRENSIKPRYNRVSGHPELSSSITRQVRMVALAWPVVALLGATAATATCWLGECKRSRVYTARETVLASAGTIKTVAVRPDGAMLAAVAVDGSMIVFDMTAQPRRPFFTAAPGDVRCAAFSPDNRILAIAHPNKALTICDLSLRTSWTLNDPLAATAGAAVVAFSPDGKTLAVGQQDGDIALWDLATNRNRMTLKAHSEFVAALAFASSGWTLASSGGDNVVRVWDLATFREQRAIKSPSNTIVSMAFGHEDRCLYVCDQVSPFIEVWNVNNDSERLRLRGSTGAVVAIKISPDGQTLAAADYQGTITFWDLPSLTPNTKRPRHAGVRTLAFAPNSRTLMTGGFDGVIKAWDFPMPD